MLNNQRGLSNMKTTLTVIDDNFLTFSPELLEQTEWKEGDVLEWVDNNDGSVSLIKCEES